MRQVEGLIKRSDRMRIRLGRHHNKIAPKDPLDLQNRRQLMTNKEVAHFFNISLSQVDNLRNRGCFAGYRIGGCWRYDPQDIYEYFLSTRQYVNPAEHMEAPARYRRRRTQYSKAWQKYATD